ncbi:hypothetical protein [uncultured Ruegeria sp.]|uniref:hypothetical protein n=1 Tax=uncultured Ruegeria sp. TaxID=259304 RepID=UPI00262C50E0|nr:hypothetical protein [uncultured Ruegeria sp.]
MTRLFGFFVSIFLGTTSVRPVEACSICLTLPEFTLADRILSANVVILARPAFDNAFKYQPVTIIKGTQGKLSSLPDIPFLIDSATRAAFRSDTEARVLLIYGTDDIDAAGRGFSRSWKKVFRITPERARFLDALQTNGQNWILGETKDIERVTFFGSFLTHSDRILRDTAMVEISRAPYELVRAAGLAVPTEQLLQEVQTLQRFNYAPVSIRLLGLQSDATAVSIVRSRYKARLQNGGVHLEEWALAGIEADSSEALARIEAALTQATLSFDEKSSLIRALSDAGTSMPEHRAKILEIYGRVLDRDTSLAAQTAIAVRYWDFSPLQHRFDALLSAGNIDPATRFAIQTVLPTESR